MKKLLCAIVTLCMLLAFVPCAAFAGSEDISAGEMLGTVDGNRYINKALGIQAEVPDTWQVLGTEEAMSLMYAGFDQLEVDKDWFAEQLEKNSAVFDFFASALDNSGDNINIQVQKNMMNLLQRAILSEDKLLAASMDEVDKAMKESGMMDDLVLEQGTCTFAGREHGCINLSATMYGVPVYEKFIILIAGDYMGTITSFSLDRDAAAKNLDMFRAA